MKKICFLIALLFTLAPMQTKAETEYVPCNTATKGPGGSSSSFSGKYGAELLTEWEKNHPDKKIVCIVSHSTNQGGFYGFWVTFEYRKPQTAVKN